MLPKDPLKLAAYLENQSNKHLGKTMPETFKQKRSRIMKEQWQKPEFRQNMIEKHSGENNVNFGKEMPLIQREKISTSKTGLKASDIAKENISKSQLVVWQDPEYKTRMGDTHKGRKQSEETKELQRKAAIKRWEDKEARKIQSEKLTGITRSEETLKRMSECKLGTKRSKEDCMRQSERNKGSGNPRWLGGISYLPYCQNFDTLLKQNNRHRFNNECQFPGCGITKEENGGRELSVHHVFTEKMACCESKIEEMDVLRKRLPKEVAKFGEPDFTEVEIMYIRMIIPLCNKHHGRIRKESDDTPFEETMYRKYFTVLILGKYGGVCYYPRDEFKQMMAEV